MAGSESTGGRTRRGGADKRAPSRGGTRRAKASTSAASSQKNSARNRRTAEIAGQLPVREGEERWTPEELEEVRGGLEHELEGFREEIAQAESDMAARLRDTYDGSGDDQVDTGAKTFEREHEMSVANNARDLLAQNERAIERIAAGTYGVCESCGNAIGKARLQAFPRATLCVTCKQREERR